MASRNEHDSEILLSLRSLKLLLMRKAFLCSSASRRGMLDEHSSLPFHYCNSNCLVGYSCLVRWSSLCNTARFVLTFSIGYVTYFLSLLGIKNYFDVSIALLTIMLVSMMSTFPMVKIVGPRKLLFFGSCGLCLMNLIMGISGYFATKASTWVFLVGIFIWAVIFQSSG